MFTLLIFVELNIVSLSELDRTRRFIFLGCYNFRVGVYEDFDVITFY